MSATATSKDLKTKLVKDRLITFWANSYEVEQIEALCKTLGVKNKSALIRLALDELARNYQASIDSDIEGKF